MRQRVSSALDNLPLEYVVDEVVRRLGGLSSGSLTFEFRDGFVVGRRVHYTKPTQADLRSMGVAYRTRLRELEVEEEGRVIATS